MWLFESEKKIVTSFERETMLFCLCFDSVRILKSAINDFIETEKKN